MLHTEVMQDGYHAGARTGQSPKGKGMEDMNNKEFELFRRLVALQLDAAIEAKDDEERLRKVIELREALIGENRD